MPVSSSSSSLSQSTVPPWHDRPEYNHLQTLPTALPPARISFVHLPQLSSQSLYESSSHEERSSLCAMHSKNSQVLSLSIDNCPCETSGEDSASFNLSSSIVFTAPFSEVQRRPSTVLASWNTKVESHRHPFLHGFSQLASWASHLHAVLRSESTAPARKILAMDQDRDRALCWSELSLSQKGKHHSKERFFCSIGLAKREIRGVEKMSLSQAEASLLSGNIQDSSMEAHVPSTGEASEKLTEQVTDSKTVHRLAVRNTAFKTTKHLLAGAISAILSRTFVAPLERLKLEYIVRGAQHNVLQTIRVIVATEGVRGFWRGNLVNLLRTAPFKSINFFCYDVYRKKVLEITAKEEVTNFERLVAGAAAGISATLLCFPMDTIRTRMVAPGGEALGGVIGCFQHMIQIEGFFSLYKGLLPAVISMAPSGAVFYGVYDILKTSYLRSPEGQEDLRRRIQMEKARRKSESKVQGDLKEEAENFGQLELGPARTLLYGAIAGICAETVTYPFEVVRRQLQMQNAVTKMGALATCREIVQRGGLGALYAGLLPSSLQVLPSAALSYFVYESMKIVLKVQ